MRKKANNYLRNTIKTDGKENKKNIYKDIQFSTLVDVILH